MALKSAIFDNTVFNFMARMNSINLYLLTKSLFQERVLVPSEILTEMELLSYRSHYKARITQWADNIRSKRFYEMCNSYDPVVLEFARSIIDKGEADAVAQSKKTGVSVFISDDFECLPFINQNHGYLRCYSTYFLLSLADVQDLLPNYEIVLSEYLSLLRYSNMREKARKELKGRMRFEYQEALKVYGLENDKKRISKKTSLDTILKKL